MNRNLTSLVVAVLFFFSNIETVSANTATVSFFQFLINYYTINSLPDHILVMDEICNNGIDDDGDGLVDGFDDDCNCNQLTSNQNLVPNGDFESRFGCCESIESQADNCLSNWIPLSGSPDFYSPDCPSADINRTLIEEERGAIESGFLATYLTPETNNAESIGTCLKEPLVAGESYTISLDIGNLLPDFYSVDVDLFFTINGIEDCNTLSTYTNHDTYCSPNLSFEELISVNYFKLDDGWNRKTITFTPTTNISAIFTGVSCEQTIAINRDAYPAIDNISIIKNVAENESKKINIDGPNCDDLTILWIPSAPNATYQWYKDSLPVLGTQDTFMVFPYEPDLEGIYHVQVTEANGQCEFYEPANLFWPTTTTPTQETVSICSNDSFQFGTQLVDTPGEYTETFTTAGGCDSLVELTVLVDEIEVTEIFSSQPAGTSYFFDNREISVAGTYFDTISTPNGCDEYWRLRLVFFGEAVEICDNGRDDDNDGLYDAFDPDCQCSSTNSNLVLNGDFNSRTGCCNHTISEDSNTSCIANWGWIQGTPDYYNPNCSPELPQVVQENYTGDPIDYSFTGLHITNDNANNEHTEALSTCLKEPMLPDSAYFLVLELLHLELTPSLASEVNFKLYGVPDCGDLEQYSNNDECLDNLNLLELLSFDITTVQNVENFFYTYIISGLTEPISGLILSGSCEDTGASSALSYLMVKNIAISPDFIFDPNAIWSYGEEIILSEINCQSEAVTLSVPFVDTLTYQWYKDSIPLADEENNELIVNIGNNDYTGNYQLNVIAPNGDCQFVQKEIDVLVQEQVIDTAITLCDGESYQFGGSDITVAGNYTQTFTQTASGCDSTVNLKLTYTSALIRNFEVTIQTNETYHFDGQQLSVSGTYKDTIPNPNGMGCDSIITLKLIVARSTMAENCNDGFDNDGDGLVDAFDDDCNCLSGADTIISNEIIVDGNPCEGTLRFSIEGGKDLPIHWFRDSIPIVRTNGGNLNFNALSIQDAAGTYHGKVTFEDGTCQLAGPLYYDGLTIPAERNIILCGAEIYQFGNQTITTAGSYFETFPSEFNGCDSAITLNVTYLERDTFHISETINQGESYDFNGDPLTTEGIYTAIFPKESNGCDSVVILTLAIFTGEICDNLLDDDGDGLIDAFDPECQCNTSTDTTNLIANSNFEETTGACLISISQQNNWLTDWKWVGGSPNHYTPNCSQTSTGSFEGLPNNSFLTLAFGTSPSESKSEAMGTCFKKPLLPNKTYELALNVIFLDLVSSIDDVSFTIYGIKNCKDLDNIMVPGNDPLEGCETGIEVEELHTFIVNQLPDGEPQTVTATILDLPHNIEGLILSANCDQTTSQNAFFNLMIDNISIKEKIVPASMPNEIMVKGNPCDENDMLRFSVEEVQGATYQWYLDAVPQPTRTTASLTFGLNADIVGTHHVFVTSPDGHCELIGPYDFAYQAPSSRDTITICPGTTILVGENIVSLAGEFTDTFPSIIDGCDSIATLVVLIEEIENTNILDTIAEGQSYDFNGTALTTTGTFRDTLPTMRGCDSIIILELTVNPPAGEICDNLMDDDGDGLVDVFDPDCQCEVFESVPEKNNLVTNGSFDLNKGCCTGSITTEAENCVEDWVLMSTDPDYYTPNCSASNPIEGFYDTPPDFSMVAINLFTGTLGADSEGLGACLKETLNPGMDYEITVDATILTNETIPIGRDAFFTIYGIADCAQLNDRNTNLGVCESGIDAIELLTFNIRDFTPKALETITASITNLPIAINGIILAVNCERSVAQDVFAYVGIESIEIYPITPVTNPASSISINGPNCNTNTQLFVEVITNADYQWYKDSVLIEGATNPMLTIAPNTVGLAGTYQVSIFKNDGTCQLLSTEVAQPSSFSFGIITTICAGESYTLGDSTYSVSGVYTQTIPRRDVDCDSTTTLNLEVLDAIVGDTLNITQSFGTSYTFQGVTYNESGIYTANLTSDFGCDSLVWLNLMLEDPCASLFEVIVEWSDTDCAVAENGQIVLQTLNGTSPFQYSIDGGTNFGGQATFNNLSAGDYEVAVMDVNACIATNFVTITTGTSTLFLNLPADTFLFAGQSFQLAIEETNFEPTSFNWTSEAAINCSDCANILLAPTESGTYTLTATDENGCQASDAISIDVKPIPQLYIPSAFSPNGDGNNDVFKIEGLAENLERVAALSIFNRWGNLIYQQQKSSDQAFLEWDGTINNKAAIIDVYIYVVSWQNQWGEEEVLRGDFTLIR